MKEPRMPSASSTRGRPKVSVQHKKASGSYRKGRDEKCGESLKTNFSGEFVAPKNWDSLQKRMAKSIINYLSKNSLMDDSYEPAVKEYVNLCTESALLIQRITLIGKEIDKQMLDKDTDDQDRIKALTDTCQKLTRVYETLRKSMRDTEVKYGLAPFDRSRLANTTHIKTENEETDDLLAEAAFGGVVK